MQLQGKIRVRADLLAEAVAVIVPSMLWRHRYARKRARPHPLSLVYFAADEALGVKSAAHALRGYRIGATGFWPNQVQVDGRALAAILQKHWPSEQIVELAALADELVILQSGKQRRLSRIDRIDQPGMAEGAFQPDVVIGPALMRRDEPPTGRFEWSDMLLGANATPPPRRHPADRLLSTVITVCGLALMVMPLALWMAPTEQVLYMILLGGFGAYLVISCIARFFPNYRL